MSIVPVLQALLAAAACFGLWRLCRAQPRIVLAGFLVRALLGQALFWISYLRLPFARSLQLGDGFWFFAVDGPFYMGYASDLAARGAAAMLLHAQSYPSMFFVQLLSLCVVAFGSVASIALLLNCAAYLLTCTLIRRISPTQNKVALAAIAFSPASILFAMQPLKDALFMLLIVAMVAAFRRYEDLWRDSARPVPLLDCTLAMCAVLYALGGIRWYFSVIAWGSAAIFLIVTVLQARRKVWGFFASAMLLVLLAQAIRLGAPDLPPSFERLLNPKTALEWRPKASQEHLATVQRGFDTTPGATTIAQGGALAQSETAPEEPATETVAQVEVAEVKVPKVEVAEVKGAKGETPPQTESAPPAPAAAPTKPAPPPVTATVVAVEPSAPPDIAPATPVAAQSAWIHLPKSALRIVTGFTAMFLPRFVGESLGLIRVGGGRGLWLFAEMDTLVLDAVLLYAILSCARAVLQRRAKLTATFVFCVLLFVMTAGPMVYTVNNFGTMFRLRLMLYCIAAILPITLRSAQRTPS
jgi:hypothetical protein